MKRRQKTAAKFGKKPRGYREGWPARPCVAGLAGEAECQCPSCVKKRKRR